MPGIHQCLGNRDQGWKEHNLERVENRTRIVPSKAGVIRHKLHLSLGGCLGPCALSNVALLLFGGHQVWFHSIAGDEQVIAIYDYVEAMVRAGRYAPPPDALTAQVFDVFDWPSPAAAPVPSAVLAEPTFR